MAEKRTTYKIQDLGGIGEVQDIELGSSFDDDRSVLQEFEKPLGAEAFESPGFQEAVSLKLLP